MRPFLSALFLALAAYSVVFARQELSIGGHFDLPASLFSAVVFISTLFVFALVPLLLLVAAVVILTDKPTR